MKYIELQRDFESKIGTLDEISNLKLTSDDISYWLNIGLNSFVKERLPESIQANHVYTEDLATLIKSSMFVPGSPEFDDTNKSKVMISYKLIQMNEFDSQIYTIDTENVDQETIIDELSLNTFADNESIFIYSLPDVWIPIGENAGIISTSECWPKGEDNDPIVKEVDVLEATIDTISAKLNNSLSEHRLHSNQAKPLRVFLDNKIILYTDGNYTISFYELIYISKPKRITINAVNMFEEYIDMPDHTHSDIVNTAAKEYLTSIERNRYLTNGAVVGKNNKQ